MKSKIRNANNLLKLLLFAVVYLHINTFVAQPNLPQHKITVLPSQPINFGTFYVIGAGTIEVDYQGNVNVTGGVISLNTTAVTPAIFDMKFCHGRTAAISYDYSVMLDGSNGEKLELIIGPSERGVRGDEFFVDNNCDIITQLRVGGKLVIPANSVPSAYSGSFPMTFTQNK